MEMVIGNLRIYFVKDEVLLLVYGNSVKVK